MDGIAFNVNLPMLIFASVILLIISQFIMNLWQPVTERKSGLVKKYHKRVRRISDDLDSVSRSSNDEYYLTFEFLDGTQKRFKVQARTFRRLQQGDTGILRSKGDWFQNFKSDSSKLN